MSDEYTQDEIDALLANGSVVECAACGRLSALSWDDCSDYEGTPAHDDIAHVPVACCWDWQCGHCGATNVDRNSPTLAECYTHVDPSVYDED